jgi:hypothetical protein
MLSLFLALVFAVPSCQTSLTVIPSVGFWSGVLNTTDCVKLFLNGTTPNYQAYTVLAASGDIHITRYYAREDGKTWDIAYEGITPTIPSVERIGNTPTTFVYIPIENNTNFSLTYADLESHRCDRLTINNSVHWDFSFNSSTIEPNKTCLLSGAAGLKTLFLNIGECPDCEISVLTDTILNFTQNVTGHYRLGLNAVLITVAPIRSGTPSLSSFVAELTSDAPSPAYAAYIDLPTEGVLFPQNPLPTLSGRSDVYVLIGLGALSFLLQILTGYVLFKECGKPPVEDATVLPTASPTGFTQAIRYVDNNFAD